MHFADSHDYAFNSAEGIANGRIITQTQDKAESGIASLTGTDFRRHTPHSTLIVAHTNNDACGLSSPYGLRSGVRLHGMLTDLNPSSRQFVEDYFEIKL